MEVNEKHERLVQEVKSQLYPWRKFTIGVDGHDGVGKSVLARYLAWVLDLPAIETDLLIVKEAVPPVYRYDDLARLVNARHILNRPVIMEGVFLLDTLSKIKVECNFLIYVEGEEKDSSHLLTSKLREYDQEFSPKTKANHLFTWRLTDEP